MIQRSVVRSLQTASRQGLQCIRTPRTRFASLPAQTSIFAPSISQRLPIQRRSYSQEAEAKIEETAEAQAEASKQNEPPKTETQEENGIAKELDTKKKEILDLTDRLKRQVADYRNLQEQTKREVQAAKDFALQRFSKDLLDSIDNLDRALVNVPTEQLTEANAALVSLHGGLKMTEQILMQTLQRHGVERFDPSAGPDRFDPNTMEATFQAPQPGKEDGTVFFTQSKGFLLNGRVLRAAKVGVVKNS